MLYGKKKTELRMCVCVCVCVCIHMYVYVYIHIYVYIYIYTHTHTGSPMIELLLSSLYSYHVCVYTDVLCTWTHILDGNSR